jgi:soluble lytic murein transglycosylase-like protein
MAQASIRALLLLVAATPALAGGLPAHPPAPPPRPVFDSDPPAGSPSPEQLAAAEAAQPAPENPPAPAEANAAPAEAKPEPLQAKAEPPRPPFNPRGNESDPDGFSVAERAGLADLTRAYAARHGVPLALLHRVIMRESKYRPTAINRRYHGLMQITHATARGMGYKGPARGLLDAETNLAYATPYLANAWALAGGDMNRAVKLYASGYYYTAKAKGMLGAMRHGHSPPVRATETARQEQPTLAAPPPQPGFLDSLFER